MKTGLLSFFFAKQRVKPPHGYRLKVCPREMGVMTVLIAFLYMCVFAESIDTDLEYRNRGNRYEGIKPKPIAGYDIELISATVDYKEETRKIPDRLKLKFYLKNSSDVDVTVRELDNKWYYWMDRVQHSGPWRQGFNNEFDWPTEDVIKHLSGIKMYDLGVVARVSRLGRNRFELIAPVIFYFSEYPSTISAYRFTLRTEANSSLTYSFSKERKNSLKTVLTRPLPRVAGGRSFTIRWDASSASEGWYQLAIEGYELDTNSYIKKHILRFYHKPIVEH